MERKRKIIKRQKKYLSLKSADSSESIKTVSKNKIIEKVSKEIKVFTLEDFKSRADKDGVALLEKFRENVLKLGDDIKEGFTPEYIKYYVNTTFLGVHVRRKWLIIHLRVDEKSFNDYKKLSKDISNRNWTVTREMKIDNSETLNYALDLIRQAYEYQFK